MCWPNYMEVRQEVTWVSERPWLRSNKGTTGPKQEEWYRQCDTCTASRCLRTRKRDKMYQYLVGAPSERTVAGLFPRSNQENRHFLIAMDYFTRWPEAYAIPNQEASTVAKALVTNFCRFGVPWGLRIGQGHNFESRVIREVLGLLGMNRTRTTPLH
jgi:hypothetical protein